ncbi:MAG: N-acetylneuraminate synthase [Bdellovibrionales bacterium]|jgi:sialic acid synthase|nr:N-acetylneuraminate synthase [Bdellovibrionales bacterium]MBT3525225.1 N-acetylneuraminate synthase [Bdellovibrionales bacterium]MBT7668249.1 N-acetylneuraminate synthase [Bdellovibrionales bacterium]
MFDYNYREPKVIAEIGCNHKGEFDVACELIDLAKLANVNIIKLQKRSNKELGYLKQYELPHPEPSNAYGSTYGKHRERLELSISQHGALKSYCEERGMIYSTSVWDVTSAREIISLDPEFIKVPSACNTNKDLLTVLRDEYQGQIHVSFGMTTHQEEELVVQTFEEDNSAAKRLVVYCCTSGYPVPFRDLCLLEINRLYQKFTGRVSEIGFSGHHLGISADIAAYTLGARWIERHFTKDRTWKGTDHAASLEPQGLATLSRNLNAVHESLNYKSQEILNIEDIQREKLKCPAQ